MAPSEQKMERAFWLDFENYVLQHHWDARVGVPCGPRRHLDTLWRQVVAEQLQDYPRRSLQDYEAHVLAGRGDEWFQEAEADVVVYR